MDVDTVRSREQVLVTIRKKKKNRALLVCYYVMIRKLLLDPTKES